MVCALRLLHSMVEDIGPDKNGLVQQSHPGPSAKLKVTYYQQPVTCAATDSFPHNLSY